MDVAIFWLKKMDRYDSNLVQFFYSDRGGIAITKTVNICFGVGFDCWTKV